MGEGPCEASLRLGASGEVFRDPREIGGFGGEGHVGRRIVGLSVQPSRDIGGGQRQRVEMEAVLALAEAPRNVGLSAEEGVGGLVSGRQPLARRRQFGVDAAVRGRSGQVGASLDGPGQRRPGKGREMAQVGRGEGYVAIELIQAESARRLGFAASRGQPGDAHIGVAARRGARAQGQRELAAERLAQSLVGQTQAVARGVGGEINAGRGIGRGPVGPRRHLGVEPADPPGGRGGVGDMEVQVEFRRQHRPLSVEAEIERADIGVARVRGLAGVVSGVQGHVAVEVLVGGEPAVGVELRLLGHDPESVEPIGAVVAEQHSAGELGVALEHRPEPGRQHLLDCAVKIEVERTQGVAAVKPRAALDGGERTHRKGEARLEGVEGSVAVEIEIDRGQALKLRGMGDQAARRLVDGGADLQRVGFWIIGEIEADRAGRVLPFQIEREVEAVGRAAEPGVTLRAELRRDADHILAEVEPGEREGADLHLDRQVRRRETRGRRGRGRGLPLGRQGGDRPAQHFQMADFEVADDQLAEQQGAAGPHDAGAVEPEPGALFVGNDDVADDGVRGQRAVHRADRDFRPGRGQGLFDRGREQAFLVALRRRARPAEAGIMDEPGIDSAADQAEEH